MFRVLFVTSASLLVLVLVGTESHASIQDYSVYGGTGPVNLGRSNINSGLVGSGGNITYDNGASALDGIRAAGNFTGARGFETSSGNSIVAGGNVAMNINSVLTGVDVIAGGTISIGATGNPAASEQPGTIPAPFSVGSPFQLPTLPAQSTFSSNANNQNITGTLALAPGTYGNVSFSNNEILELTSGDYIFNNVDGANSNIIRFDLSGGAINIFVDADWDFGNNLNFELTGGDASDIYIEAHGDWLINNGGNIFGTIYTPEGVANFGDLIDSGNSVNFTGALWSSGGVNFRNGAMLDFVLNDQFAPTENGMVPEATSFVVWVLLCCIATNGSRRHVRKAS